MGVGAAVGFPSFILFRHWLGVAEVGGLGWHGMFRGFAFASSGVASLRVVWGSIWRGRGGDLVGCGCGISLS